LSDPIADTIRLLRRGPFARYIAGESISMIGTWMQMFAQGWLLTNFTLDAIALAKLTLCSGIPALVLSPFAGSFADRFDKRRILLVVLICQIALAVLVGWLAQTGAIQIWHLYVITTLLGVLTAFEVPTVSAFVPELVPRSDLARALSIDRATFHFTRMIGPALAGWLVGMLGVPTAYYINAATFLALMAALLTIPPRPPGSAEEEEERQGSMRAGFDFVRQDAPTRAMILLMAAASCFASPFFMITLPVYARGVLGLNAAHTGLLMAASGIGSFTGALSLMALSPGGRARFLKLVTTAAVLGLASLSVVHSFAAALVSMALMTLGLASTFGTAQIVVQERAPDAIRGRVSAVASLSFFATMPFAGLAAAELADRFGLRQVMFGGAIAFGLSALALLAGRKQLASAPPS